MSASGTKVVTSITCTMNDSGAASDESGYATDNSCANSSSQVSGKRLGPIKQLDSIKCYIEREKLLENDHAAEGHEDNVLENLSNEFCCGSQKCLGAMKFNSQTALEAVCMCEGSCVQNLSAELTKKCLWSGSCSPSVSTSSIPNLGGCISFSCASEFSDSRSMLDDYRPSCSRVTSTPFGRSSALPDMILQGKHIRQSFPSLHNTESRYSANASQSNSPVPFHQLQKDSYSSLGSFTSDYFSTSSIATLTTPPELRVSPKTLLNSSNSMARDKVSKYSVWPQRMSSVDDAKHSPDQPVDHSCQSLPSDNRQLLKCSSSVALPCNKQLINQEISSDSAQHSSYSSNLSDSFATTELQSSSFPGRHTDHFLMKAVTEPSLKLKQYLLRNDKDFSTCGEKCIKSFCRTINDENLEGVGKLVKSSPVSDDARSKMVQDYECLQSNLDLSIIQRASATPMPPSNRLVRSASSPNLSPQTSVNDASREKEPSCQTSTSSENLFKAKLAAFSSFLLLPSAKTQYCNKNFMQFSHSSYEIQSISDPYHHGSVLNNQNKSSPMFLSTPDLSHSKLTFEHSLLGRKIYNFFGEAVISPVYRGSSIEHFSNKTTDVTKPPMLINAVTNPPFSIIDVTNPSIAIGDVTQPLKLADVVAELPNKSDSLVDDVCFNILRSETLCKHTSTDHNSEELYSTLLSHSDDSLILPCPDNCKTYPFSPSLVLHSKRHPLNIANAKRNLGLNDLQLKQEDCTSTDVKISRSCHHTCGNSNICKQENFGNKNSSTSQLLLNGSFISPKFKLLNSGYPFEDCTSFDARPLQHMNNNAHHFSIPLTLSPSHLSTKPPSASVLFHSNRSSSNLELDPNYKQSERQSLLHNRCITATESKITLPDSHLLSRRPCVAGKDLDHLTFSQHVGHTKDKEQGISDHTNIFFTHTKLNSESDLPKLQTALPATHPFSRECKRLHQPLHRFSFLPLVTANPAVRRASLSVVTLLMEEAPYLLPVVLRYLAPRDLVAVSLAAKQLRSVVMETSCLHSKILKYGQSLRVLGKENVPCLGKTGYSSGPAPRAALNQLNIYHNGCSVASVLQAGDQLPPRERLLHGPVPTLTGRKDAKRSPRKILGAIQLAVSSLQAAISPNKAAMRVHAAKAAKSLKCSKKLFLSGSGLSDRSNNAIKSSSGADSHSADRFHTSLPCQCPQCLAASQCKRPRAGAAGTTSAASGASGQISSDYSDQALDKTGDDSVRRSLTAADKSGSLVSSCSTNNIVFAKDDSPTKFSPIKLNLFSKSTKKRLRRL